MRRRWLAVVLALVGCQRAESFVCAADDECVDGSRAGTCEPSGFCSFPDAACASGQRYGEYASAELAGSCAPEPAPVECEPACGPCEACEAGVCVVQEGRACEVECGEYVFGLAADAPAPSCLAYASGPGAGACDAAGACVLAEGSCQAPGAEIVGCDAACGRDDHNCTPGAAATSVTAATLCATGVETAGCMSSCVAGMGNDPPAFTPQQCDADGRCTAGTPTDCGLYVCADASTCATTCAKPGDCAPGASCDMTTSMCGV